MENKRSIFLKLTSNLELIIQGVHIFKKVEPDFKEQFNITKIDIIEGTLIDYTNYIENLIFNIPELILIDHFSELSLIKLKLNVYV